MPNLLRIDDRGQVTVVAARKNRHWTDDDLSTRLLASVLRHERLEAVWRRRVTGLAVLCLVVVLVMLGLVW